MERHLGLPDHSGLMLAARITFAHLAVSDLMTTANSSGELRDNLKTELRDPLAHVSLHGDLHDVRMHLADDGGRRAGWR